MRLEQPVLPALKVLLVLVQPDLSARLVLLVQMVLTVQPDLRDRKDPQVDLLAPRVRRVQARQELQVIRVRRGLPVRLGQRVQMVLLVSAQPDPRVQMVLQV